MIGSVNEMSCDRVLWNKGPEKSLTVGKRRINGRGCNGITVWHRGGGHKRKYRKISFSLGEGKYSVERIEYDPNRTANIALIKRIENDTMNYILATSEMSRDAIIEVGANCDIKDGYRMPLSDIPLGTIVNSIEVNNGQGAVISRSAGSYSTIISKNRSKVVLKLRSGQKKTICSTCHATIGIVSNIEHKNKNLRKAGRKRWLGIRPTVRGVAMNPIDHPHGGGEGKASGGRHPVTPWGRPTKGFKTVHSASKKKKYNN